MEYDADTIRTAWRDAVAATIDMNIRDIHDGQPDDREWIDMMWRDLGWGWYIDSRGDEGYDEAPESWCGAGLAWAGRHRLGEHIEPDMCVDLSLSSCIASEILPGTGRMYDSGRWRECGVESPRLDPKSMTHNEVRSVLGPGVIFTVGDEADGSHIVMVDELTDDGRIRTLEANSFGVVGDDHYAEGFVRRFETTAEDYRGDLHDVEPRSVDEIVQIYPFDETMFS